MNQLDSFSLSTPRPGLWRLAAPWFALIGVICACNVVAAVTYVRKAVNRTPDVAEFRIDVESPTEAQQVLTTQTSVPIRISAATAIPAGGAMVRITVTDGTEWVIVSSDELHITPVSPIVEARVAVRDRPIRSPRTSTLQFETTTDLALIGTRVHRQERTIRIAAATVPTSPDKSSPSPRPEVPSTLPDGSQNLAKVTIPPPVIPHGNSDWPVRPHPPHATDRVLLVLVAAKYQKASKDVTKKWSDEMQSLAVELKSLIPAIRGRLVDGEAFVLRPGLRLRPWNRDIALDTEPAYEPDDFGTPFSELAEILQSYPSQQHVVVVWKNPHFVKGTPTTKARRDQRIELLWIDKLESLNTTEVSSWLMQGEAGDFHPVDLQTCCFAITQQIDSPH